jgi:hypothetical protein
MRLALGLNRIKSAAMNWNDPNLWFEGLGSSAVGGAVAAVTALFVVRMTNRRNREEVNELEARQEAMAFLRATNALSTQVVESRPNTHEQAKQRALAHTRWAGEMVASLAPMRSVDEEIGATVQSHVARIAARVKALSEVGSRGEEDRSGDWDQRAEYRTNELLEALSALNLDLVNWLTVRRR